MVINTASLKRDGVQDFVSLRTTALIQATYAIFMLVYFITTPVITYEAWSGLFSSIAMKVFTLAVLVSIMIHTRIGLWQVATDYVKNPTVRTVILYVLNLMAFAYVAVGLFVLWGV